MEGTGQVQAIIAVKDAAANDTTNEYRLHESAEQIQDVTVDWKRHLLEKQKQACDDRKRNIQLFESLDETSREIFMNSDDARQPEEYLLFPSDLHGKEQYFDQDGPHQTLRWRRKARNFFRQHVDGRAAGEQAPKVATIDNEISRVPI